MSKFGGRVIITSKHWDYQNHRKLPILDWTFLLANVVTYKLFLLFHYKCRFCNVYCLLHVCIIIIVKPLMTDMRTHTVSFNLRVLWPLNNIPFCVNQRVTWSKTLLTWIILKVLQDLTEALWHAVNINSWFLNYELLVDIVALLAIIKLNSLKMTTVENHVSNLATEASSQFRCCFNWKLTKLYMTSQCTLAPA